MAKPGWYPDPFEAGRQRYWDGLRWTANQAPAPIMAPAMSAPGPDSSMQTPNQIPGQQTKGSPVVGCLTLLILAGLALGGLMVVVSAFSGPTGQSSYSAQIAYREVKNPATVWFRAQVTNTGSTAATPTCLVRLTDSGGAYSGYDSFKMEEPIPPGEMRTFSGDLIITDEGAVFVTEGSVDCS